MNWQQSSLAAGAVLAIATSAFALTETFTVTFDGTNEGGWTWGAGDTIVGAGGNPDAYLETLILDTFAPRPRTTVFSSEFHGDYAAKQVTAIGIDLITFSVDFSAGGRPLTLMLVHDPGTPANPLDDTAAYTSAANIPFPGEGWIPYDFAVPSSSPVLPAGWALLNLGDSGAPAAATWSEVIADVDEVRFFYGQPDLFFIFQGWDLGMDNCRITVDVMPPNCPGDLDGCGTVGFSDLTVLLSNWGKCLDPVEPCPGDLDGNDVVGFADLTLMLSMWGPCPSV